MGHIMDGWYYQRKDFARHILNIFKVGISDRITLFAPRRKGKTWFLLKDLAPLASQSKYVTVYTSLWSNPNEPHKAIIKDMESVLKVLNKKGAVKSLLTASVNKISFGNDILGKGEIHFPSNPNIPSANDLACIDDLISRLCLAAKNKSVLLLIDEIQHITTDKAFDAIAYALRTAIDKRSNRVKVVFTGSSRSGLNLLFNKSNAAFYHFSYDEPFPDLDSGFLLFLQNKLEKEYKIKLSQKALLTAFENLNHSPYWMIKAVQRLVLKQNKTLRAATDYIINLLAEVEDYASVWDQMSELDRCVYAILTKGEKLFSNATLNKLSKQLDRIIHQNAVQRSVKSLIQKHLITQVNRGEYLFEMPGFHKYCLESKFLE